MTEKRGPETKRVMVLTTHSTEVRVEQAIRDHMPVSNRVYVGERGVKVADNLSLDTLERTILSARIKECRAQWLPDVVAIIRPHSAKPIEFLDTKTQETVLCRAPATDLSTLDTTALWIRIEEAYLKEARRFSDPYQYADKRRSEIRFVRGSPDELEFGITNLAHAFPKLYQKALSAGRPALPGPRLLVYSGFDTHPPGFGLFLWEEERQWQPTPLFACLLTTLLSANEPRGYRYVSPQGRLSRKSQFIKQPQVLALAPDPPSDIQIVLARQFVLTYFNTGPAKIPASVFNTMPWK